MLTELVLVAEHCEAEIGSIKHGWHACGKKATVLSVRELPTGARYRVYFCKHHAAKARQIGTGYRVVETRTVEIDR